MPSRSTVSTAPFQPSRRSLLATAAAGAALAGVTTAPRARAAAAKKGATERHVHYVSWSGADLVFGPFDRTLDYTDPHAAAGTPVRYEMATWTSPVLVPGFGLTELVASWNAATPGGSWVEVRVRGTSAGTTTKDYVLGRWAAKDPDDG